MELVYWAVRSYSRMGANGEKGGGVIILDRCVFLFIRKKLNMVGMYVFIGFNQIPGRQRTLDKFLTNAQSLA